MNCVRTPFVDAAVAEALQQAACGVSGCASLAWAAAVYLMDQVGCSDGGVARGLVFGGMSGRDSDGDGEWRVRVLLSDPRSRPVALNALRSPLARRAKRGYMLNVASLLVLIGEPLIARLLGELDSEFAWRHSPFVPLAALALSGRAAEASKAAALLNLRNLANLIGPGPYPEGAGGRLCFHIH